MKPVTQAFFRGHAEGPVTLIRKQTAMASQMLNQRVLREQAGQAEPPGRAGLDVGVALVPLPQRMPPRAQATRPVIPLTRLQTATTLVGPEEVLVADPRGGLTPTQMVEQKLLALLPSGHPGPFIQAAVRSDDVRRILGGRNTTTSFPRTVDGLLE